MSGRSIVDGQQRTGGGWSEGVAFDLDFDRVGVALHGEDHRGAFVRSVEFDFLHGADAGKVFFQFGSKE